MTSCHIYFGLNLSRAMISKKKMAQQNLAGDTKEREEITIV